MRCCAVTFLMLALLAGSTRTLLAQTETPSPFLPAPEPITVENAILVRELAGMEMSINHYGEILWSPNSESIFVDGGRGVWFYTLSSNDAALQPLGDPDNPARSIAISPDERVLAFSTGNTLGHGDIHLRSMPSGEDWGTLIGFGPVAFSPDGTLLAFSSREDKLYPPWKRYLNLWNIRTDQKHATLIVSELAEFYADQIAFSPDGTLLAFALGLDLYLWNIETNKHIDLPRLYPNGFEMIAFHPDGSLLFSPAASSNVVGVWDVETGEERGRIRAHSDSVLDMAVSPNGTLLATGGWYGASVRLWDISQINGIIDEGMELASLEGHACCAVQSVAFNPDGTLLASGGSYEDGTIILWNVETKTRLSILEGHNNSVRDVQFSPNGQLLASVGDDNRLRLWGVPAA